jgi:hypothetical protein
MWPAMVALVCTVLQVRTKKNSPEFMERGLQKILATSTSAILLACLLLRNSLPSSATEWQASQVKTENITYPFG